MAYSDKVLDHFKNPRNVGSMDKDAKNVGTGLVGAPECGDVMRLQIEVDEASGKMLNSRHLGAVLLLHPLLWLQSG
jgi:NifU-like protein involved in Fe-S cluster formation